MRRAFLLSGAVVLLGGALVVPPGGEGEPPPPEGGRAPFAWNRDAAWAALEARFLALRDGGCPDAAAQAVPRAAAVEAQLAQLETEALPPSAPVLDEAEQTLFDTAATLAACPGDAAPALRWVARFRDAVKRQSARWNLEDAAARARLYRLLYGARGALEEALLQQAPVAVPPLALGRAVPSAAPSAVVQGVTVHSGDLLVSRGGAATSALIARGSDFPGNFSHVALLHVDAATKVASVVEAHIEVGVTVSTLEQYLADTKLRVLVLRPREDLPALQAAPLLPHLAAEAALARARRGHVAYDFAMDAREHSKLFCSEVAFAAYEAQGLRLWPGLSPISSAGTRRWLWALGVRHFATLEPSDLEYDPQLAVVAEWFDPEALAKDHRDNAVTDALLEAAEAGATLDGEAWRRPLARLAKAWSVALGWLGRTGPVPEGMSAEAALRSVRYTDEHAQRSAVLAAKAADFHRQHGYAAPYWQLVRLARDGAGP